MPGVNHLAACTFLLVASGCGSEVVVEGRDDDSADVDGAGGAGAASWEVDDPAAYCLGLKLVHDTIPDCDARFGVTPCTSRLRDGPRYGCGREAFDLARCFAVRCEQLECGDTAGEAWVQCGEDSP